MIKRLVTHPLSLTFQLHVTDSTSPFSSATLASTFQLHVTDSSEALVLNGTSRFLSTPCNGFFTVMHDSNTTRRTSFQLHVTDSSNRLGFRKGDILTVLSTPCNGFGKLS